MNWITECAIGNVAAHPCDRDCRSGRNVCVLEVSQPDIVAVSGTDELFVDLSKGYTAQRHGVHADSGRGLLCKHSNQDKTVGTRAGIVIQATGLKVYSITMPIVEDFD